MSALCNNSLQTLNLEPKYEDLWRLNKLDFFEDLGYTAHARFFSLGKIWQRQTFMLQD